MSTENLRVLTGQAVENITHTFTHYSAAFQDELPHFTSTLKAHIEDLVERSPNLIRENAWPLAGTIITLYLTLVHLLRFRNQRQQKQKYAPYIADPSKIDYKVAHGIYNNLIRYEAPFIYGFSSLADSCGLRQLTGSYEERGARRHGVGFYECHLRAEAIDEGRFVPNEVVVNAVSDFIVHFGEIGDVGCVFLLLLTLVTEAEQLDKSEI